MKLLKSLLCIAAVCSVLAVGAAGRSVGKSVVVADKPGMTIKGVVSADGKPLAGVVVSDGHEVTTTDRSGCYWLPSAKRNGNVFISIPSGYEVPVKWAMPQFWAGLETPAGVVERHDFTLTKVDNDNHILLAVTDMHLSDQYNDLEQFCTTFLPSVRDVVRNAGGRRVYTLNTGDMSFDVYWYSCRYPIEAYKKTMEIVNYPTPVFHAVGNHDNDGATPYSDSTDFVSAARYRRTLGPTYYSFNIGKVHYVVLDNIVYLNEPGGKKAENIAGSRNYTRRVTPEQLEWLKKDLALVKDPTAPVIVGMHAAAYHYKGITPEVVSWFSKPEYSAELTACFDGFEDVHYITGHTHMNNTTYVSETLTEHNLGAVCASWWVSGAHHYQNLCPDASPGGYGVFEIDGKRMKWHYHSIDGGAERQFRAFDMNEVRRYYSESEELEKFIGHYPARRDFRQIEDNIVYLNVWNWAPDWKISVTENGRELDVVRERAEDPLYTISYELLKIRKAGNYPSGYKERLLNHMFRVEASSPTSTLEIRVTDRFGRVYTERMERPKVFGPEMR